MMKIGLYDPYLETLGGGEKVFLTVLEEAVKVGGADITLFAQRKPDPTAWKRLNIAVKPSQFRWQKADDEDITGLTEDFDLFITIRGDIPPESRAKRSVAIIQFPFEYLPFKRKRDFVNPIESAKRQRELKARLASYDSFLVWTKFVQKHVRDRFDVKNVSVIGAPVDVPTKKPKRKEPIILAVGRFITHGHHKKQDLMIEAFRNLQLQLPDGSAWTLHLAGGADSKPETKQFIKKLQEASRDLPVEMHINAPYADLVDLYRRASIFWHAAGAEEDPKKYPERLEHFGITTVEAMMYGLVPVVIGRGGQLEIVTEGVDGFFWQTPTELALYTQQLIEHPKLLRKMSVRAQKNAKRFSKEQFAKTVHEKILKD